MPEEWPEGEGPDNYEEPPPFFSQNFNGEDPGSARELVEVAVEAVYLREDGQGREHFVVLRDGYRRLPIAIDPCNAHAISLPLDGAVPDRPLTHDLTKSILEKLGGKLDRIVIDDLWSTTYYAKLLISRNDEEYELDSRPSDAIAIAIRLGVPIFVSESIMQSSSE